VKGGVILLGKGKNFHGVQKTDELVFAPAIKDRSTGPDNFQLLPGKGVVNVALELLEKKIG
jgi:hypothetical protein